MKIKEVSVVLNIPVSTILYYERNGLLTPKRKENKYRDYDESNIRDLKIRYLLREFHFPIKEIKDILFWNQKNVNYKDCEADAKEFFSNKRKELVKQIEYIQKTIEIIDNLPIFMLPDLEAKKKYEVVSTLVEKFFTNYQEEKK